MEQTVQVIVADGIETLPKEFWPPKDAIFKLMMVRQKTYQMHLLLNTTLNQIVNALNTENIPSVLLKGQGVAQNYRNPESRMCGDIDLYVGITGYKRACEIISNLNNNKLDGIEAKHHMHLHLNGVEVEVHRWAENILNKFQNEIFRKWTIGHIDKNFNSQNLMTWNNNGTSIKLPSATFDSFFLLHHAVRHMTTEGVGLRQICDWTMYLHKHHQNINTIDLKWIIKNLNMETVWKEFGLLAINYLGLPSSEFPLCPNTLKSCKTLKLINQIFISGNFGRFDASARDYSKTTYIKRKWRSFCYQTLRLCKLFVLFPKYAIAFALGWFTNGIKVVINGE